MRKRAVTFLGLVLICASPQGPAAVDSSIFASEPPSKTALDDYVTKVDPSYSWRLFKTRKPQGVQLASYILEMTSQTWRDPSEVDPAVWRHWIAVQRPTHPASGERVSDTALLLIGGGANKDAAPDFNRVQREVGLALSSNAVVATLFFVPNQPTVFGDDDTKSPRFEDDLIAYTWNKYMDTGDATWLARMPMVKSAVRAMDTLTSFLKSEEGGGITIEKFAVAGASKRGWTTWLTGAVDKRVSAIIPIVIDVVNVIPSMEHHYAAYGFWAPSLTAYEQHGIMKRSHEPEYKRLIRLVDPYHYRHRLKLPKYIVNAAGDQFFVPDSSRFYFDDLEGEKYLRYVPNAEHSLKGSDAVETIQAFFEAVINSEPRPRFSWKFVGNDEIRVTTVDRPAAVTLWQATNPKARDFRLRSIGKAWTGRPLTAEGSTYSARLEKPREGWSAAFVELEFARGARHPFKFTSGVRIVPDTLPFSK